jgi:hypothetical protein
MDKQRRGRGAKPLFGMLLLALAYHGLLEYLGSITGVRMVDGVIGVLLGLYICSHPAANAIDLIFLERGGLAQISSEWSGLGWLALNVVVTLVGWLVIVMGTTRLVG